MTLKSDFANRLKEERKNIGFSSQVEVAEKCNVVKDVWGRYERGTSSPTAETLLLFMEQGADIPYLFTGRRSDELYSQPYLSDSEKDLLFLFRNIENKKTVIELLESLAYKQLHAPNENLLTALHLDRTRRETVKIESQYPDRIFNIVEVAKRFKPRIEELGKDWGTAMALLKEKYSEGIKESELEKAFQSILNAV